MTGTRSRGNAHRKPKDERADVTTDGQVSLSNGTLQRKRTPGGIAGRRTPPSCSLLAVGLTVLLNGADCPSRFETAGTGRINRARCWTSSTKHPTGLPCWRHADALRGEVVDGIEQRAWVHHIQRLLVLGNLAMLAGVSPQEMAPVLGRY
jgi:hypothetical protein